MELVYLWVEDYKNIKRQGFNFSPMFHCEFKAVYKKDDKGNEVLDAENSELIIEENDDYIENFFGENINVTAIVGRNGSGKSSLLRSLIEANDVFFSFAPSVNHKFIMCYIKNENKFLQTNIEFRNDTNFEKDADDDKVENAFRILHYDISLDFFTRYQNAETIMLTEGTFNPYITKKYQTYYEYITLVPNKSIKLNELNRFENRNIIKFIKNSTSTIDMFFEPRKIFIHSYNSIKCLSCDSFDDLEVHSLKNYSIKILKLVLKEIDEQKIKKEMLNNTEATTDVKIMGDYPLTKIIENLQNSNSIETIQKNNINILSPGGNENIYINSLDSQLREKIIDEIEKMNNYIENSKKIKEKNTLIKKNDDELFEVNVDLLDENSISFIYSMEPFLTVEFFDTLRNISYKDLSNGEKELLRLKFYIEEVINSYKETNILILIDEINNYLHPNWQKILINYLVNSFQNKDCHIHFLLTTHSPFLLSDIPKQNIIFLDTDEKGNCKVVDGLKEKKETFGANIHTLLSDSFFMEDGLMGEFAKSKIDEVIKLLNKEHLEPNEIKHCEQIISIIGEPIIKNQLQKMLDSKRLKKIDKIDDIEKSIQALQEELEKLKNAKS